MSAGLVWGSTSRPCGKSWVQYIQERIWGGINFVRAGPACHTGSGRVIEGLWETSHSTAPLRFKISGTTLRAMGISLVLDSTSEGNL